MIKRTVEISRRPAHLSVRREQLVVTPKDGGEGAARELPCEDLGVVCVDQPQTTYTHRALVKLLEHGATVILCGRDHLPAGLLLPLSNHSEVVSRLRLQLALSKPRRKRLWQQIVQEKIRGQAANLEPGSQPARRLLALVRQVRSGDTANHEAQAARLYWRAWLGTTPFRRDPRGEDAVNGMLNYGYTILRAAVARALVSAGFQPALGLHHSNRGNPFCLADDLLEPLRPLVDARVRELARTPREAVDPPAKAALLEMLAATVRVGESTGPLMVALHRTVGSLARCYEEGSARLLLPEAVGPEKGRPAGA